MRDHEKGSTAIEFGLLAVPFLAVLLGMIETGVVLLFNTSLEHTTQQIARMIKTGQIQAANVQSEADFRSRLLCPAGAAGILPSFFNCDRLILDIRVATGPNTADLSKSFYNDPSARRFCLGSAGSLVVVRVGYAFPAILPILSIASGGGVTQNRAGLVNDIPEAPGWNHLLFSATIFQNETVASTVPGGCA